MTYTAPLADMRFALRELAGLQQVAALPGYEHATDDTIDAVLEEAAKLAGNGLAPLNREGDKVALFYWSANYDESVFADPDRFDITRSPNPHVGFGAAGPHFCLGAQFARRELRTMLDRLSRELTHVELDGEPEWAQSHFVSGVKHLPLAYAMR